MLMNTTVGCLAQIKLISGQFYIVHRSSGGTDVCLCTLHWTGETCEDPLPCPGDVCVHGVACSESTTTGHLPTGKANLTFHLCRQRIFSIGKWTLFMICNQFHFVYLASCIFHMIALSYHGLKFKTPSIKRTQDAYNSVII